MGPARNGLKVNRFLPKLLNDEKHSGAPPNNIRRRTGKWRKNIADKLSSYSTTFTPLNIEASSHHPIVIRFQVTVAQPHCYAPKSPSGNNLRRDTVIHVVSLQQQRKDVVVFPVGHAGFTPGRNPSRVD